MRAEDFLDGVSSDSGLGSAADFLDAKPPKKQNKGIAADLVTDLKRGVEQLPGIVTGVADIPIAAITGDTYADKAANALGGITGFAPAKWAKEAEAEYSPGRVEARRNIDKAWEDNKTPFSDAANGDMSGIGQVAKAYIQNPQQLVGSVVESLPSMIGGAKVGQALTKAAGIAAPVLAGAGGEGAVMAGQQMNQLTEAGADPRTAAAASAVTGLVGGATGVVGGKLAQRMGVIDPDTAFAGGAMRGVTEEAKDQTIKGMLKEGAKRVAGGAVSEGAFEELPQSVLEQVLSNLAQSKPWDEGVSRAAVEGTLAGSLMGGAFNIMPPKVAAQQDAPPGNPTAEDNPEISGLLPAPVYPGTPGEQIVAADAERQAAIDAADANAANLQAERDAYEKWQAELRRNNITIVNDPAPLQQRIDALMGINEARLQGFARTNYEKAIENAFAEQIGFVSGKDGLEVPFTMGDYLKSKIAVGDMARKSGGDVAPAIPVVGPLSAAANLAVQSGAHAATVAQQAAAQAEQNTSPEGKSGTPAGAQSNAAAPAKGPLTSIAAQAPAAKEPANVAVPAQTAPQADQGNAPKAGAQPAAAPQAGQAPAGKFDLSNRTETQLTWLTTHGQNGFKEAAVAELKKRGVQVSATQQAKSDTLSAEKPANSATVHAQNAVDSAKSATPVEVNADEDDNAPTYGGKYDQVFKGKVPNGFSLVGKNTDGKNVYEAGGIRVVEDGEYFVRELAHKPKQDRYAEFKTAEEIAKERGDVSLANEGDTKQADEPKPEKQKPTEPPTFWTSSTPAHRNWIMDASGMKQYTAMTPWNRIKQEHQALLIEQWGDKPANQNTVKNEAPDATTAPEEPKAPEQEQIKNGDMAQLEADVESAREEWKKSHAEPIRQKLQDAREKLEAAKNATVDAEKPAETSKVASGKPEGGKQDRAPTVNKSEVAKRRKVFEREVHVSTLVDAGLNELAGTTDLDTYTKAAELVVANTIAELKKDAVAPEAKAALDAMVVDGKPVLPKAFFESAFKSAKTAWENKQKEDARDPELYKETLRWGMSVAKIEDDSEDAAKYKAGFDHALRGQTKSTLPNDSDTYLKGYNDARAWIKTEDGRAWFDGKRIEKQKNTGVVLKRWWERVKKDIAALTDTSEKAWESLLKSTARSDLFPMTVIADDATPGAKEIMEKLRANTATFQEFFWYEGAGQIGWKTGRYSHGPKHLFSGNYGSYKGRISGNETDEQRLAVAKDIAGEYQEKLKAFVESFDGVKSLDDIQAVVDKLFFPDGRTDEKGKLKDWRQSAYYAENRALFAPNSSKIMDALPLFEADAWDAKYRSWTKAKASEDIERAGRGDRKDSLIRPRLDKIIRSGLPNERGQRNISSAEFKKTFGFADVVIGQYVTGQQAQDHLNYAYDALMTMADLLGAKPKQLSFGGKLYFTIGALGHGKYAAHFSENHPVTINGKDTTVPVINVTATRGDGSVLHEFFHAIDFLTTDPALKKTILGIKELLNRQPGNPDDVVSIAEQFLSGSRYMTWGGRKDKGTPRDQAIYALTEYFGRDSKRQNTDFYREALALDKGSAKPYWSNDAEPFARMAEAWGLDTLTQSGKRDDYMQSDWATDGKVKRPQYRGAPYPMANERTRLVALFQRFVDAIEWTDAGPVLKSDSPWQKTSPWTEANKPYLDALKSAADNIDAIDAQRKENEARKKADTEKAKLAAIFGEEKPAQPADPEQPPAVADTPEADNVGMSEDELAAIFDEEAAALREETQEQPQAPAPGEKALEDNGKWTQEDLQFVLDRLNEGQMVLVAGENDLGIPTIHSMPNGDHVGFGVIKTGGLGWEATFTAGGAMSSTPGGISYTTLSASKGKVPASIYNAEDIKNKIKGRLLAKSGPRAAPKLSDEQEKTAAALAKEMAQYGVQGIDEALKGLVSIFGGGKGKLMSFPGGFDEDSYKAAKPHFLAAAEAFGKAGMAFKDFVRLFFRSLIQQFGDGVKPYAVRFAKDYEAEFLAKQQPAEPAKSDEPTTEYVTESASRKLAEWVRDQIDDGERFDWRALFAKADEYFGGTQANGVYTPKDAYDAMELGINLYLLDAKQAYPLESDASRARRVIEKLDTDILNLVATQTKRTAEQDEFQQFSTPPTYAYLANWVANLNAADTYLEPSAGIGGLAVFGKNAGVREVVVNELSARRLGVLQNMPFDRYFSENAEQLNNVLPAEIQPTVIVMNPPFSATAGRVQGQRDTMNGAKHIEQALKRLNSGGRLVAIVGEGMAADRPAFRDWWKKILAEYNVRANVGIEGSGYVKYGTTFDNQILVIDKNGPTSGEIVTGKVKSPAEALALLEEVRATRPVAAQNQESTGLDRQPAGQPGGRGSAEDGQIPSSGADAGPAGPAGMDSNRGAGPGRGRGGSGSDAANGDDAGAQRPLGGRRGQSAESGRPDRGTAAGTDGAGNAAKRGGSNESTVDAVTVGTASAETASGEIGNSVFEQYSPKKVRIDGAVPHNTPLVESAALASVVPPDPTYAPNLNQKIIKDGLLSDAQLEAVVYAGQAHQQMLPDGKTRRGFFLGDGTGVGKGRQISGVILDNWNQGRKKAVWISKKKELIVDAKRDFGDLGGDPSLLVDLGKKKIGEAIGAEQGILFAGYPTIRGQTKAARDATRANKGKRKQNDDGISYERIQQIVDWVGKDFDGALIFDEAHEMGNAVPVKGKRGQTKPSDQALAALELQRALPLARVMYVSATGATEVSNLAYAERLGIWGDGTPFSTVMNFVAEMSRSVAAMELVAQNLKQMGLYLARSLSYDGVQYERLEHTLTGYQRETYDKLAEAWQVVLKDINKAFETTGVMSGGKAAGRESGKVKSNIMSAFWGAHQRFFNQVITASQMPSVIKQMEDDIAAGKSIVLQITNTNEADQTRALAKLAGQKVSEDEDADSLEELDLTPRDQLIQLVARAFPVAQYETYTDDDGKEGIRQVKDSNGLPVMNREAMARRDEMIEELRHFEVPDSPLQMIVDVFGAEKVAEITGRTQRVVTGTDGKRKVEKRSAANVAADSEAFKNGKKSILIFSQAGGTGFSFHADRRYKNKAQRVHYVLQPGWSADKAVQGFGRSHRTNQVSAPIYRLITTDIPAQKRFISSVARRLEQLGALTAGQRDTAGGSMFSAVDNLESKYATMAVRQFFEAMKPGTGIADMPADLLDQMGLSGLYDDNGSLVDGKVPPVTQFLNRLLSLKLDAQQAAFDFFMRNMEAQIDLARRTGAFDDGMQTIRHKGAAAQNEQVVYTDPMTGAPTKYYEIQYKVENPIYPFATANTTVGGAKQGGWFKNNHSGRIAGVWTTNQVRTDKEGRIHKLYGIWRTSGTTYENANDFKPAAWTKLTEGEAKALWEAENSERPTTIPRRLHMVVGGILPIWDRFNNEHVSVVRLSMDDGRRLLGRQVMDKDVADTMNRLNVQSTAAKMGGADLVRAVLGGSTVEMSNRIRFKLATVSGQKRIELDRGNRWFDYKDEANLRNAGVINERIEYKQRYFIPADPSAGGKVLDEIMSVMAMNPVSVINNEAEQEGAGNIASPGGISPADKAIYGMAAEGKSAAEVLKFIATASRNPFYRQLAKLLMKTGIAPSITVGDGKGWKFNAGEGNKYAAGYNPKTDTISLFRPASAERNMLHELMHAATLKALSGKGMAAAQMNSLYQHVKKTGKLKGMYGMSDVDEFIAETFSNPKFQQMLKQVSAPQVGAGKVSSAWNWFVRIVRGILGLKANEDNALSRALEIGVDVMRENMKAGEADGDTRYATGPKQTDSAAFSKWFGDSKVVNANGEPLVVYHGTNADFSEFKTTRGGEFGPAIYFTDSPREAGEYSEAVKGVSFSAPSAHIMPMFVRIENPYTKGVDEFWKEFGGVGSDADGVERAKAAGYDGVIAKRADRYYDNDAREFVDRGNMLTHYIAFDKSQAKSAIGNNGNFDANNSDIRYNVADEGWDVAEPSKMDEVIYALQDKHIDTKRVIQAIMGAGKKIRDNFNPYLQEELFHGRAAKGVKDFLDFELRPLLKQMQDAGVDMGDFEEYLWNRHAEERNKQIAKINPDMPDGGSGIETAAARAYLAGLPSDKKRTFESLAAKVSAMNRNSQGILVSSGLEKQSTIDAWNGAYQHYVPLQREDVDNGHVGTGKGFSVRGSSTKRAMGSGRAVVDIIANLTQQRERNIVRAEKNRVSNALAGLAVENPNADFWTVDKAPKERVVKNVAIYNVLDSNGEKVADFTTMDEADRMARSLGGEVEQTFGDRVQERVELGFKNRDNVVLTRINGEDHYIVFNERDERAMRMATAMKNLDVDNLGRVLSVVGKATRYLASINTQYNPVFGVINLIRDAQGALLNLSSTPLAGEQKRVMGYTKDALVGIYKDIRAHRAGKIPSSNWAALFEEFQKEGGQTGYRDQYANAETRSEAIKSELAQFKEGKAKQLTRGLFGWLSDYNETMENAVRLAAYKAAKEKGMSKQQAASLAKNITVNFNRKGQMATQVGALYAFFNASVQGTARIAETLFEQHGGDIKNVRLSKTGKKIVLGGIMLGSMQALLLAAAGYDDDEPPEFVRERNLILPIGDGKYLTLAMPLGFHVLPGIGRIATEFVMSGGKDPIKKLAAFGSMFAEAFNPVGNSGFSLQTITPSVVDPFAALAENKDFTGREIFRENFNSLNPQPGHARAKDVATIWSRLISQGLNFISGGSDYRPGMISWSPDAIDYLIGQASGGVGRELGKAAQTGESMITGEELPLHKVPLLGRFVGDTQGSTGQSQKFYDSIRKVNMLEAEYKGLLKDGQRAEATAFLSENPGVRLILAGNAAENQVKKLRAMRRDLIERDAGRDSIRAVEERITETMRKFDERAGSLI